MAVAQALLLNSARAAELIREKTGRRCSRQNMDKLCRSGRLPKSCVSLTPIRINPETLVEEYLNSVDQRYAHIGSAPPEQPAVSVVDQAPERVPRVSEIPDERLPDYNESRARSEYERANLLELERKLKENLLIPTDKVEKVWSNAVAIARTKLLAVPSRMRQRIPHLTVEEIALAEELIRESLEELASGLEEESDDD